MSKKGIKMSWDPTVKLWYLCADAAKIAEVVGSEDGQLVQVENPHLWARVACVNQHWLHTSCQRLWQLHVVILFHLMILRLYKMSFSWAVVIVWTNAVCTCQWLGTSAVSTAALTVHCIDDGPLLQWLSSAALAVVTVHCSNDCPLQRVPSLQQWLSTLMVFDIFQAFIKWTVTYH